MSKRPLEIDMLAGSQIRDSQGEILDIAGANIDNINYFNADHGQGFFNRLGYVTEAKKIMKAEDCDNERHRYYWEKVKSPYIYVKGRLYDDEDHPHAKAAAAIIRNIHKNDLPYKVKASVEGATISRGVKDPSLLAQTKIVGVALTFVPANHATVVEPINMEKSATSWDDDKYLIESISHLVKHDPPSFRHIERQASANAIIDKVHAINNLAKQCGIDAPITIPQAEEVIRKAIEAKISDNIQKITDIIEDVRKSNYGPKGAGLYNPTDNIKRKENRTGEVVDSVGQNKAVHEYTSATMGTAKQQANLEAKKQKKLNAKQPVKVFSPEEKAKLQAEYEAKAKVNKAMTAGYGGAGAPSNLTGGGVFQSESLEPNKFKHITCFQCGDEQIHSKYQVRCRKCRSPFTMEQLAKLFT